MHVPPRDRQVLEAWARSTSGRAGLAQRALIVLLAADGVRTSEIVARTGASKPTVATWKKRYAVEGLGGLQDRRKPGRPRRTDDAAIVLATLKPPPKRLAVTHWSSRLLASELGMSNVKVAETWRQYGLEPWRREPFTFSTDPRLEAKSRAVTGLYLNPPDHAIVLSMADERGRTSAHELLAALEAVANPVAASTVVTSAYYPRRRHRAYLHFLQQAAAACRCAELHIVAVDNYATLLGVPAGHPAARWLPVVFLVAAMVGLVWAVGLRVARPDVYAAVGAGPDPAPGSDLPAQVPATRDWPIATPSRHWRGVDL